MTHGFDKGFWERHWQQGRAGGPESMGGSPPNPYLARETSGLTPGTALDAGCGAGAEAIWLASHGWHVTAADISSEALARAAERAATSGAAESLQSATSSVITARMNGTEWEIVTAEEHLRTLTGHGGRAVPLHDVVVRATRRR
jgi:2-polyprenyl-3-methyl-5-hydroxy-6-metoxy-1,4-benzoquinol methylase